ncbi:hypothetical protein CDAR_494431 [Caerostris darwini]|uniref:Uncharacterized protein n=1 Tax=Caerostris darwini TaxID=1538125 RepID=A0AAV4VEZ5_9ARAC|nr:hypothetical protein CDAR_494431 [Caerostris darwini]
MGSSNNLQIHEQVCNLIVGKENDRHHSDISDASGEVVLLEESNYDFTQLGEVVLFKTPLEATAFRQILKKPSPQVSEHEHKKPHPEKCIPASAVRTSSSPSMGMISTTLVIQKKCVLLCSMPLKVVRNSI